MAERAGYDFFCPHFYKTSHMHKKDKKTTVITEDRPNRASYHHGSTTQGGSNYGQGSMQLGRNANKQGSEGTSGSNYDNERGWNNEALRSDD